MEVVLLGSHEQRQQTRFEIFAIAVKTHSHGKTIFWGYFSYVFFRKNTLILVSLFIFRHKKNYFWNTQNRPKWPGNPKFRIWKSQFPSKSCFPSNRTSRDKYMLNNLSRRNFWDMSQLVRLEGKHTWQNAHCAVQWWCYRVDQAGIGNSHHLTTQQGKWLSGFLFCLFAFVFIVADKTWYYTRPLREGIQKKSIFLGKRPKLYMGGWGSRVLNLWKCENTRFLRNFWLGVKSPKLYISAMWVLKWYGGWVGSAV